MVQKVLQHQQVSHYWPAVLNQARAQARDEMAEQTQQREDKTMPPLRTLLLHVLAYLFALSDVKRIVGETYGLV